jgi:hypothetical protein
VKGWKWARELRVQIGIIAAAFDHLDRFAVAVLFNARCLVEIRLKAKGK